ncbi:hypothetical protein POTOM_046738 [Populus tomentosa]|uniref:Uncharacterized protein n=1 Tax=Populus tomentosa TaxID=118781 RepID=A0A8X7YIN1_POPTO|nr:hypothetical protein POTOM_046738 [Populus tomentosa]
MGNWFARIYQAVLSVDQDSEDVKSNLITLSSSSLRIKVRMTTTQLKELMTRAGSSPGNSELGSMILQECLDGRFRARVVVGDEDSVLLLYLVHQERRVWRRVPLHLLLKKCGIYTAVKMELSMFINFEGAKDMPGGGGSKYGTSIKKEFALDPFWLMGILGFGFSKS